MFNSIANIGNLAGLYSGSPLVAAVSNSVCRINGKIVSCNQMHNILSPIFLALAPFFALIVLIGIAAGVLLIVSWWKVFQKASRPGWPAIVPIYNTVIMLQIVGMSPWLVLLAFIPGVGGLVFFIISIFINIKLAKAFGKDEGFAVGLILLPVIFVPILAFGQAKFTGPEIVV